MILIIYLLIMNAVGLVIMHADKQCAVKKAWRIPEATLLSVAILGGSIGAWVGMYVFHHKTRKPKFYLGVPCILILQAALAVAVLHTL